MTKFEKTAFNNMLSHIAHDIRRKFVSMKSGTNYVMVPLSDVLAEISTFANSTGLRKKKRKQ
jgi:hypothetical protein